MRHGPTPPATKHALLQQQACFLLPNCACSRALPGPKASIVTRGRFRTSKRFFQQPMNARERCTRRFFVAFLTNQMKAFRTSRLGLTAFWREGLGIRSEDPSGSVFSGIGVHCRGYYYVCISVTPHYSYGTVTGSRLRKLPPLTIRASLLPPINSTHSLRSIPPIPAPMRPIPQARRSQVRSMALNKDFTPLDRSSTPPRKQ